MKTNVGAFDQWLRFALGFLLIVMAGMGVIGPWGYVGVVPLATAAVRYCPLYQLLGISSCPRQKP